MLEPITDQKDIYKVEMWLVQLKAWLESEAIVQPKDVSAVYAEQAKEIADFLNSRA